MDPRIARRRLAVAADRLDEQDRALVAALGTLASTLSAMGMPLPAAVRDAVEESRRTLERLIAEEPQLSPRRTETRLLLVGILERTARLINEFAPLA